MGTVRRSPVITSSYTLWLSCSTRLASGWSASTAVTEISKPPSASSPIPSSRSGARQPAWSTLTGFPGHCSTYSRTGSAKKRLASRWLPGEPRSAVVMYHIVVVELPAALDFAYGNCRFCGCQCPKLHRKCRHDIEESDNLSQSCTWGRYGASEVGEPLYSGPGEINGNAWHATVDRNGIDAGWPRRAQGERVSRWRRSALDGAGVAGDLLPAAAHRPARAAAASGRRDRRAGYRP